MTVSYLHFESQSCSIFPSTGSSWAPHTPVVFHGFCTNHSSSGKFNSRPRLPLMQGSFKNLRYILFASAYFCITTNIFLLHGSAVKSLLWNSYLLGYYREGNPKGNVPFAGFGEALPKWRWGRKHPHEDQTCPPPPGLCHTLQLEQDILPGSKSPPHPLVGFPPVFRWFWCDVKAHHFLSNSSLPPVPSAAARGLYGEIVAAKSAAQFYQPCPGSIICGMS